MKGLKAKLMSAVAMLTVAAVMLVGTSYAWFTLSTAPEIKGIKANVSANENLEIALDNGYANSDAIDDYSANAKAGGKQGSTTGNPYTWGNLVDLTYAFSSADIVANKESKLTLKPVAYSGGVNQVASLQFPKYDTDGRIKDENLTNLTGFSVSDLASITEPVASSDIDHNGVVIYGQDTNKSKNTTFDALSTTYWLRSNMATTVSLSGSEKRAESGEDKTDGSSVATDPNLMTGSGSFISIPSTAGADSNKKLLDWLQTGKLTIQIDVVNASGEDQNKVIATYYAYPRNTIKATPEDYSAVVTEANDKFTYNLALSSTKNKYTNSEIAFTQDEAKMLTTYVYLDGELITNKDAFLSDLTGLELNIQFAGTGIDDAMDVK